MDNFYPFSSGVYVDTHGIKHSVDYDDITLTPVEYWNYKGKNYPIKWHLVIEHKHINADWQIEAAIKHQMMDLTIPYWEGAVNVIQTHNGNIRGYGFLEMTGY